jgi:hypothetical protein
MTESELQAIKTEVSSRLSNLLGPIPAEEERFFDAALHEIKAVAGIYGTTVSDVEIQYFTSKGLVLGIEAGFEAGRENVSISIRPDPDDVELQKTTVTESRYSLIRDGDGHWCLCPADRTSEAKNQWQAIEKYWREGNYDQPTPSEPDFVRMIGSGPSNISFTDPQ